MNKFFSVFVVLILALFFGMCDIPIATTDTSQDQLRSDTHFKSIRIRKVYYPDSNNPYGVLWVRSNLRVYVLRFIVETPTLTSQINANEWIAARTDYVIGHNLQKPTVPWSTKEGQVRVTITYKDAINSSVVYTDVVYFYMIPYVIFIDFNWFVFSI